MTATSSRPRIAMLVTRMDIGGVPDHIMALLTGLSQEFEFVLICDHIHESHRKRTAELGVKVHELKMQRKPSLLNDLRSLRELLAVLREGRFDLIHTHTSKAALLGAIAGRLARLPASVNTAHNLGFIAMPNPIVKACFWIYDRLLFSIGLDAVIVVSKYIGERTRAARLIPRRKLHVIYNGILKPDFGETGVAARHQTSEDGEIGATVICVARLVWFKGLHTLIAAMPEVLRAHPRCRLLLVGDGELEGSLRDQAVRLGCDRSIEFLGLRHDVPRLLAKADVFALSSVSEGLPISILEAMTAGLPVVATSVGGVPELVEDGVTGLLVPPENSSALAAALVRLLDDRGMRQRMGEASQARVTREFSVAEMHKKTSALYRSMLGKCRAGH